MLRLTRKIPKMTQCNRTSWCSKVYDLAHGHFLCVYYQINRFGVLIQESLNRNLDQLLFLKFVVFELVNTELVRWLVLTIECKHQTCPFSWENLNRCVSLYQQGRQNVCHVHQSVGWYVCLLHFGLTVW